ncbi:uncharacterized protein LOC131928424 [Physella acuta]|uniref:uncharacterized protein LOC131928424 n=1 Tax=Physella acuta TaxID=109671 RepID=UPI0027DC24C3|nr:uncharacterized protein LOC131928424 [Physella acuta]
MQYAAIISGLCLIISEYVQEAGSEVSLNFLNQNGLVATLDGYLPRCPGCVVFGRDPLYVYGTMYVPNNKLSLMNRGIFYLEVCGWNEDCQNYQKQHNKYCSFQKHFVTSCEREKSTSTNCYCHDFEPKRWYARIIPEAFVRPDMTIRFLFDTDMNSRAARGPYIKNQTLFIKDLIDLGFIGFGSSRTGRSANRSSSSHEVLDRH